MLGDLDSSELYSLIDLRGEAVPKHLVLLGTRALASSCEWFKRRLDNVRSLGGPNTFFQDIIIGSNANHRIVFASVYGGSMAAELVHFFGTLGTETIVLLGSCGAISTRLSVGDLVQVGGAYPGEGVAQYYAPKDSLIFPSLEFNSLKKKEGYFIKAGELSFTTGGIFAETKSRVQEWADIGATIVDMETASVFAVANAFSMTAASILYVSDHLTLDENIKFLGSKNSLPIHMQYDLLLDIYTSLLNQKDM